jgi:hypothetical protein
LGGRDGGENAGGYAGAQGPPNAAKGRRFALGAILILLTFVLAAVVIHDLRGSGASRRMSLLLAAVASGVWVVAGTEILSLFSALGYRGVFAWWGVAVIALGVMLVRRRPAVSGWFKFPSLGVMDANLVALGSIVGIITFCAAMMSPPNNWDSMGYHMPRQVMWMMHGSVRHYSTFESRQLEMPPLAEFMGVHLMILSGGDRLANLEQWAASIMTAIAVSLIAREIGAGRRGQILAGVMVLLFPPLFQEASNTKNDVIEAMWVCGLMAWAVFIYRARRTGWMDAVIAGAFFGLALATKGTAFIFCPPLALVIAWCFLREKGWRAMGPLAVIAGVAMCMVTPHYLRNEKVFGSPLGSVSSGRLYNNEEISGRMIVSNVVRNCTLYVGSSSVSWNAAILEWVERLHARLGLATNDSRTTFQSEPFHVVYWPSEEDATPAGVAFAIAIVLPLLAIGVRRRVDALFWVALAIPYCCFVLFCAELKWQPWHTRLHIPIFCLGAAPAAVVLSVGWARYLLPSTVVLMALNLWPTAQVNHRPVLAERNVFNTPRIDLRFAADPTAKAPVLGIVSFIRATGLENIAIWRTDWEYPIERLLLDGSPRVRFRSFNPTISKNTSSERPAEIVVAGRIPNHSDENQLTDWKTGMKYLCVQKAGRYLIFVRADRVRGWMLRKKESTTAPGAAGPGGGSPGK